MKREKKIIYEILVLFLASVCLSACGQATTDTKEDVEETYSLESYKEQLASSYMAERTSDEESTTLSDKTNIELEEGDTTSESNDEMTTVGEVYKDTSTVETTTQPPATTKQSETTKKQQTTTKKQQKPSREETTTSAEDVPDGTVWRYRSNIYANDPIKSKLEQIFWDEFGMTLFSKKKNDEMVTTIVELVYDIMNNNKTDFERERALYEAICLTCEYDYESLDTGLTHSGQTVYGVLIDHKAVCGGYASTFHIGLTMMGIKNNYINCGMTLKEGLHAWVQVCLDGEWYEVDVTWGDSSSNDPEDAFNYKYFNITSEQLSKTHYTEGNNCTGTKYNEDYLIKMYLQEFVADRVYMDTTEEYIEYVNSQADAGNSHIVAYVPNEIITELIEYLDYDKYPFTEKMRELYYDWSYASEECYYKYVSLPVTEMIIDFKSVDEYRTKDNFCETVEDIQNYINEQRALGNDEILLYYNLPDYVDVIYPDAPDGMTYSSEQYKVFYFGIGNLKYLKVVYSKLF